jgi:hypothetical protein
VRNKKKAFFTQKICIENRVGVGGSSSLGKFTSAIFFEEEVSVAQKETKFLTIIYCFRTRYLCGER